jgi:Polyketide cyclase / dehydrase and lipid transport
MSDGELDRIFAEFIVEARVFVNASPESVWRLVSDVQRIGEFSPECVRVELLGGPAPPQVGARFNGTNRWTVERLPVERQARVPPDWSFEWTLPCEVVRSAPHRVFAYVVGDRFDGSPSTEWSFEIDARDGGSLLTERMRHFPSGRSYNRTEADRHPDRARQIVQERTAVLREDLERTLAAMRAVLEGPR